MRCDAPRLDLRSEQRLLAHTQPFRKPGRCIQRPVLGAPGLLLPGGDHAAAAAAKAAGK